MHHCQTKKNQKIYAEGHSPLPDPSLTGEGDTLPTQRDITLQQSWRLYRKMETEYQRSLFSSGIFSKRRHIGGFCITFCIILKTQSTINFFEALQTSLSP